MEALQSNGLQEWVRVSCRMHILTDRGLELEELTKLWQKRMTIWAAPPRLFSGITRTVTKGESQVSWQTAMCAKLVVGTNGLVAVAIKKNEAYETFENGTALQGALASLFRNMWESPPLCDLIKNKATFNLIATSVKAVYDHTAKQAGLLARLVISHDKLHVDVKHAVGDSATYLLKSPEIAKMIQKPRSGGACNLPGARPWLALLPGHTLRPKLPHSLILLQTRHRLREMHHGALVGNLFGRPGTSGTRDGTRTILIGQIKIGDQDEPGGDA